LLPFVKFLLAIIMAYVCECIILSINVLWKAIHLWANQCQKENAYLWWIYFVCVIWSNVTCAFGKFVDCHVKCFNCSSFSELWNLLVYDCFIFGFLWCLFYDGFILGFLMVRFWVNVVFCKCILLVINVS
jgi:hypothetical protein